MLTSLYKVDQLTLLLNSTMGKQTFLQMLLHLAKTQTVNSASHSGLTRGRGRPPARVRSGSLAMTLRYLRTVPTSIELWCPLAREVCAGRESLPIVRAHHPTTFLPLHA